MPNHPQGYDFVRHGRREANSKVAALQEDPMEVSAPEHMPRSHHHDMGNSSQHHHHHHHSSHQPHSNWHQPSLHLGLHQSSSSHHLSQPQHTMPSLSSSTQSDHHNAHAMPLRHSQPQQQHQSHPQPESVQFPQSRHQFLHLMTHIFRSIVQKWCDHAIAINGTSSGSMVAQKGGSFYKSRIPSVTLENYLYRIIKHAHATDECLIIAIVYLDRLVRRHKEFPVCPHTIHRLMLTSIMTAIKFHEDFFNYNSYYAQVGGVPRDEMNLLEIEFLYKLNFGLRVKPDEYATYRADVLSLWNTVPPLMPATENAHHHHHHVLPPSSTDSSVLPQKHHHHVDQHNQQQHLIHSYVKHLHQVEHQRSQHSQHQQMYAQMMHAKPAGGEASGPSVHLHQQTFSHHLSSKTPHSTDLSNMTEHAHFLQHASTSNTPHHLVSHVPSSQQQPWATSHQHHDYHTGSAEHR
mmetsp:Transcript_2276/g.8433  ORF Transcript_2276/g.8433 Transcript_2276/m.8433 type:complete len:461 (-) Transcript_2276:197-1579(-)|eukprot:CAMPEP_0117444732 /NCGR_PEP_ID=MMETSP0759-20121206/5404_1 /TAXON_ID=63605 /ORGANISM="Percolomonas cosmopolitus, Strain WS" /LENGTH=460 /DNA_ID=CAMNT_0005236831 /DNA_START=1127 /DNA_END=2509 /DNA_ORIENTATION=+